MGQRIQARVEGGRDGEEEKVGEQGREREEDPGRGGEERREGPWWRGAGGRELRWAELGSNPRQMRCWPFSRTKCS